MQLQRQAGMLIPLFSIPSEYGIGDLGSGAYECLRFMEQSGLKVLQILPIGPTGNACPYQCFSSFAGNPLFIDPEGLVEMGLMSAGDLEPLKSHGLTIDYERVTKAKYEFFWRAFKNLTPTIKNEVDRFVKDNEEWIVDYSLFMALKKNLNSLPIYMMDRAIRKRNPATMELYRRLYAEDINFFEFLQYIFFLQYSKFKSCANNMGIRIFGDVPMYPSADSSDVWAHREIFDLKEDLNEDLTLRVQAGVPGDYYNPKGQCWGNPVYKWDAVRKDGYNYWLRRFRMPRLFWAPEMKFWADIFRIDHARAISEFFTIPAESNTAEKGEWKDGPGEDFFNVIKGALGNDVLLVAEDLGKDIQKVQKLLAKVGIPGMSVFQFGMTYSRDNTNCPDNWEEQLVGYTGTHDNPTTVSAIKNADNKEQILRELGIYPNVGSFDAGTEAIAAAAIKKALDSSAYLVIIPWGDFFAKEDAEARINVPGVADENWNKMFTKEELSSERAAYISWQVITSNRG